MFYHQKIHITTKKEFEIVNITDNVKKIVDECNVEDGLVNISTKHTTTAVVINEDEHGLLDDYERLMQYLIPNMKYNHDRIDNNAKSHLMSILQNANQTIQLIDTNLSLGIWQSILFVDFDGPRKNREVIVSVIGDDKH